MASEIQSQSREQPAKKSVTIIVNGRENTVEKDDMTFEEIVALAQLPSGPNITYTVTYRRGPDPRPDGTLVEGQSVKVKDGMIFNVTATDRS
jgi:hypothetical protein